MPPEDRQSAVDQTTVRPLAVPEIVTFPAELDAARAGPCGSALLLAALQPGVSVVIADMSRTEFCDPSGVRSLLISQQASRQYGAELRVVVAAPAVLRTMNILGVDQVLRIYHTMADALTNPTAHADAGEQRS